MHSPHLRRFALSLWWQLVKELVRLYVRIVIGTYIRHATTEPLLAPAKEIHAKMAVCGVTRLHPCCSAWCLVLLLIAVFCFLPITVILSWKDHLRFLALTLYLL